MGSDPQFQIPVIKFSTGSPDLERGTKGWHNLCKRVREACENNGCFEILYDKIPLQQRAKAFSVIKQLFGLPLDTKKKNVNPKPYHSYAGQYPSVPLYESFGLEDASDYDSVRSFLEMMWPNGNDEFWETMPGFRLTVINFWVQSSARMKLQALKLKPRMGSGLSGFLLLPPSSLSLEIFLRHGAMAECMLCSIE